MSTKRREKIEDLLLRGGAINWTSSDKKAALLHPSGGFVVDMEELNELLDDGSLIVINCGCNGYWWALRPDLIATRAARKV